MSDWLIARCRWLFVGFLVILAGCAESSPPPFRLDMNKMVANGISPENQVAIADTLDAMFGTPDQPFAMSETGLDQRKLTMAAGPVWGNRPGEKRGLYRRHCAHCHGINGDGHGPTAAILNPYPRDYRPGIFKFKSTYSAVEPTDEDLRRIILNGVPGTAMPSFRLYPPDEIEALMEYVKYLSLRGQMETKLVDYVANEVEVGKVFDPVADRTVILESLTEIVDGWKAAAENIIAPAVDSAPPADRTTEQLAESIAKGRELFYSATKGNCMQCHGPTALGDGQQTAYDNWSEANRKFIIDTNSMDEVIADKRKEISQLSGEERTAADAELDRMKREYQERLDLVAHMLPPRTAIPRNLRENVFRGGRRPLDLYWRISAGIAGTPMPNSGPATPGAQATLTEQEIWQVVDYVQSLPFEPASRPQRRPVNQQAVN